MQKYPLGRFQVEAVTPEAVRVRNHVSESNQMIVNKHLYSFGDELRFAVVHILHESDTHECLEKFPARERRGVICP